MSFDPNNPRTITAQTLEGAACPWTFCSGSTARRGCIWMRPRRTRSWRTPAGPCLSLAIVIILNMR
nr:capsid protein [Suid alphaherpesvirus 1]